MPEPFETPSRRASMPYASLVLALLMGLSTTPAAQPTRAWQVDASQAETRILPSAPNFREVTGYRAADGRRVRAGVLYRSETLTSLNPPDLARLARLNIKTFVDLRMAAERERAPFPEELRRDPETLVIQSLRPSFQHDLSGFLKDPESASILMSAIYARLPDAYAAEYAKMFRALVDGRVPMVVFCTAGRDRTGVGIALVLAALGVPRASIVRDYLETNRRANVWEDRRRLKLVLGDGLYMGLDDQTRDALSHADAAYINAALDAATGKDGTVDAYLTRLGLTPTDRAKLRDRLLE